MEDRGNPCGGLSDSPAASQHGSSCRRCLRGHNRKSNAISSSIPGSLNSSQLIPRDGVIPPLVHHNAPLNRVEAGPLPASPHTSLPFKFVDSGTATSVEEVEDLTKLEALEPAMGGKLDARDSDAQMGPGQSGWFSWPNILSVDKLLLASFSNVKKTIRNSITKKFQAHPNVQIEEKDLNELKLEDVEEVRKEAEFLDCWRLINLKIIPYILWHLVHLVFNLCCIVHDFVKFIESSLISSGVYRKYKYLDVSKLQNLAIAIESDDALQTDKVVQLLQWLNEIGVKHVCLYDADGVLKKAESLILQRLNNATISQRSKIFTLDIVSSSDGMESIAKAANFLLAESIRNEDDFSKKVVTELRMTEALKAVDAWGPDPELLLVYGPARCHLGFPAWRIRYTEIVHMGSLKSMKYGDLVKAIYRFTMVRQNFGK